MIEALSLSIFTIEADRKPVLAFAAKKHEEADAFFRDKRLRTKLRSLKTGGSRFAMAFRFYAFGWPTRTSVHGTAKKRQLLRLETGRRSFWWT
jgi:hypothetical protein